MHHDNKLKTKQHFGTPLRYHRYAPLSICFWISPFLPLLYYCAPRGLLARVSARIELESGTSWSWACSQTWVVSETDSRPASVPWGPHHTPSSTRASVPFLQHHSSEEVHQGGDFQRSFRGNHSIERHFSFTWSDKFSSAPLFFCSVTRNSSANMSWAIKKGIKSHERNPTPFLACNLDYSQNSRNQVPILGLNTRLLIEASQTKLGVTIDSMSRICKKLLSGSKFDNITWGSELKKEWQNKPSQSHMYWSKHFR